MKKESIIEALAHMTTDEIAEVAVKAGIYTEQGVLTPPCRAEADGESEDPLVVFLYLLMRDHLTPGTVSNLRDDSRDIGPGNKAVMTNRWLAQYAKEVAAALR